jgi:hypothetical protein
MDEYAENTIQQAASFLKEHCNLAVAPTLVQLRRLPAPAERLWDVTGQEELLTDAEFLVVAKREIAEFVRLGRKATALYDRIPSARELGIE